MPSLMYVIGPGFLHHREKFLLSIELCRITMPYLLLISVAALFGAILNTIEKFAAFAFVPVLFNIGIVVGTIVLRYFTSEVRSISYAILIAGLLQLVFMIFALKLSDIKITLTKAFDFEIVLFLRAMIPAIITAGLTQINLFISNSMASFIDGGVSILSYADRLYQFPLSIIGITLSTVLLPALSKAYKSHHIEKAEKIQLDAVKVSLFLSLPCSAGLLLLSYPIIHIIYEHGAFLASDTQKTSYVMMAFSIGLPAFILNKALIPIFYANSDTKTPMKITVYSIIANITINVLLMFFFGCVGIALGSSISAWYSIWLTIRYIKKYQKFKIDIREFLFKTLFCVFIIMLITILLYYVIYNHHHSFILKFVALSFIVLIDIVVYFILSFKLGVISYSSLKYVKK